MRILLVLLMLLPAMIADAADFTHARLQIVTQAGATHDFDVELALTPDQQRQGLMFREALAGNAGMLFVLAEQRPVNMWMKNTLIPLDMLFLAADGTILAIAPMTTPLSEQTINPGVPVKAVLELQGGVTEKLSITPGDRIVHPLLGS